MNEERFDRLLAKLGGERTDTARLEVGFETRVLRRIRAEREEQTDLLYFAWRFAPAFITLSVLIGLWLHAVAGEPEFDHFASSSARNEGIQLVNYLGGD